MKVNGRNFAIINIIAQKNADNQREYANKTGKYAKKKKKKKKKRNRRRKKEEEEEERENVKD